MNSLLLLKRPFVWLRRFRHRRGYGVHSPFAFDFITRVVYEHTPYYQYKELSAEQRRLASEKGHNWACRESQKVKRLLFRLVNRAQPTFIVSVGPDSAAELYMKAAKKDTGYLHASQLDELFLERGVPVDFLYLHDYRQPSLVRAVFDVCADRVTERSVLSLKASAIRRQCGSFGTICGAMPGQELRSTYTTWGLSFLTSRKLSKIIL